MKKNFSLKFLAVSVILTLTASAFASSQPQKPFVSYPLGSVAFSDSPLFYSDTVCGMHAKAISNLLAKIDIGNSKIILRSECVKDPHADVRALVPNRLDATLLTNVSPGLYSSAELCFTEAGLQNSMNVLSLMATDKVVLGFDQGKGTCNNAGDVARVFWISISK